MKTRIWWFLSFYIVLSLFVIYCLVYLIQIWKNHELQNLFKLGFNFTNTNEKFFTSFFIIFVLPIMGLIFAFISFIGVIVTQNLSVNSLSPNSRFGLLIACSSFVIVGFLLTFTSQTFYIKWNKDWTIINLANKEFITSNFYKNWLSSRELWAFFGIFFGLIIVCYILLIKLHFINLEWYHYVKKNQNIEDFSLKKIYKKPHYEDFDNTKTISIVLDTNLTNNDN